MSGKRDKCNDSVTKRGQKTPATIRKSKRFYQSPPGNRLNVAAVIRMRLDPNKYFEYMHRIANDELVDHKTRMQAWQHLVDRGWGKPLSTVAVEAAFGEKTGAKLDLSKLSNKELAEYERMLLKVATAPAVLDVGGDDE